MVTSWPELWLKSNYFSTFEISSTYKAMVTLPCPRHQLLEENICRCQSTDGGFQKILKPTVLRGPGLSNSCCLYNFNPARHWEIIYLEELWPNLASDAVCQCLQMYCFLLRSLLLPAVLWALADRKNANYLLWTSQITSARSALLLTTASCAPCRGHCNH